MYIRFGSTQGNIRLDGTILPFVGAVVNFTHPVPFVLVASYIAAVYNREAASLQYVIDININI